MNNPIIEYIKKNSFYVGWGFILLALGLFDYFTANGEPKYYRGFPAAKDMWTLYIPVGLIFIFYPAISKSRKP